MSLARLGCDGSDVYVYSDVEGGFTCNSLTHRFNGTAEEMVGHLMMHRHEGRHHVPESVFEALRGERPIT